MYKVTTLQTLRKSILPLCFRYLSERGICTSVFQQQYILQNKNVQLNSRFESSLVCKEKPNFFQRIKNRFKNALSVKTKTKIAGCLVYEKLADTINYEEFFERFNLPDTFQSWFTAMALHVWMCLLVTVPGSNARIFRNSLVDTMWHDVEIRLDRLAHIRSSDKKKFLKDLVAQFNATLMSYDEGILDDKGDTVLAASVWRTLFSFKPVDPQLLEDAVLYIRQQVSHLDSLNQELLSVHGVISFQPLKDILTNSKLN